MELRYALIFYVLVVVSLSVLIYVTGLKLTPSILAAMLVGLVILIVLKPPLEDDQPSNSESAFYFTIQIVTLIFALITLIYYISKDKRHQYVCSMI